VAVVSLAAATTTVAGEVATNAAPDAVVTVATVEGTTICVVGFVAAVADAVAVEAVLDVGEVWTLVLV
jgi:hypothetical protein